jgi:hypothetical protein
MQKPKHAEQSEHEIQCSIFAWNEYHKKKYPGLDDMFAVPNGGHRHIVTATRMKKEGVKPGVSDILWMQPIKGFHGVIIEVKKPGGRLTLPQRRFMEQHIKKGYLCVVVYSLDEYIEFIKSIYE